MKRCTLLLNRETPNPKSVLLKITYMLHNHIKNTNRFFFSGAKQVDYIVLLGKNEQAGNRQAKPEKQVQAGLSPIG